MRTGDGFMLVFSLAARNSFIDIPLLHDRCLQVKDKDKVPMVIVGNKCDLFDKFQAHFFSLMV